MEAKKNTTQLLILLNSQFKNKIINNNLFEELDIDNFSFFNKKSEVIYNWKSLYYNIEIKNSAYYNDNTTDIVLQKTVSFIKSSVYTVANFQIKISKHFSSLLYRIQFILTFLCRINIKSLSSDSLVFLYSN